MNEELYELGRQIYLTGEKSLTKIGEELHISRGRLGYYIKSFGEKIINKQNTSDIYSDIFLEINSEEKAYWLGFLYADGYVSDSTKNYHVELGLKESDYGHLEKFKKFLNARNKISYNPKTRSYKITINNKKLHLDLINKGCVPRKSNVISFPDLNILPNSLIKHFIRGYIDGDGWIGRKENKSGVVARLGISSGSYQMLLKIIEKTGWKNAKIIKDKRSSSTYNVSWSGKYVINMLDFLYKDASIYLERKYNKYIEIQNAVLNQNC